MLDAYIYLGLRTPFGWNGGALARVQVAELLQAQRKVQIAIGKIGPPTTTAATVPTRVVSDTHKREHVVGIPRVDLPIGNTPPAPVVQVVVAKTPASSPTVLLKHVIPLPTTTLGKVRSLDSNFGRLENSPSRKFGALRHG